MPDILIRGMEEPPRCSACRMLDGDADDGFCHAANKWLEDEWFYWFQYPDGDIATDKPLNCPLVPLPEGHGRLIDADAVVKTICNSCDGACDVVQCDCLNCKADCRCDIVKEISDAPTIVPAEGGKDDGN